jgi:UDP-2,3-diacylglucosamine pyrophosphatase LpxH
MVIIAASDQHLGYVNSDKAAFNGLLDALATEKSVTDLVLLGDVMDMWRRDASGVFLENKDTLDKIAVLPERLKVHYIAGNHDYHVLKLKNHGYLFQFVNDLSIPDGNYTYKFLHGWEFDDLQQPPLMEALCRVMSDQAGDFESGVWAQLTRDWSDAEYFFHSIFRKRAIRRRAELLQQPPESRLQSGLSNVERKAIASVKPGEVFVFGHTHHPFVNTKGNVVNCGSWVTDAPVHNTYVRLEAGKPRLFVFGGKEITERVQI